MPFEKGGRADKQGNRYEINCIIYELLKILNETNYSVIIEALGEDEIGTDILVTTFDGKKEHQQCKARNASKEYWSIPDLKEKRIFFTWKTQLNRDNNRRVSLVSPMACSLLLDLHNRACNTSGKSDDFYEIQIMKSSKEFQKFYKGFCSEMGLNCEKEVDVLKSIDYLKRIFYKQISEYELQDRINQNIQYLFSSEQKTVYNALLSFVTVEDILGKEITQSILSDYFIKQEIVLRLKEGDKRIAPRIDEINREYRENFRAVQGTLIHRDEFDACIKSIENEKSTIISGGAGSGKSGCTEAILNYCEERKIPHIAIKLDQRIPCKNCESWGKELGLPNSIAHSLHCISKNENAVIILDQLDALRWTQANSSEALAVCMELIRQVDYLNNERKKKIIIIFVCRTYDLENDNNINSLFRNKKFSESVWQIVKVGDLKEDVVKGIIGRNYEQLSLKLKRLLRIPSNLYIWQHLDKKEAYGDCLTTSHLIDKWFQQIGRKSVTMGLQQRTINKTKKSIVDALEKTGHLYVPKQILHVEEDGLDYLVSSEIVVIQNNRVGFVHQSILDYFMSQRMMEKYFDRKAIENIIGVKCRQTPERRYQVQMFLQNLLEYDSGEFILFGKEMLASDNIRYYVKYVFYEILGQIQEPDDNVIQFIIDNCQNEIYGNYLLNNVIFKRKQYITILRNQDVLERWYSNAEKKSIVFNLLASIAPELDDEDISFIERHAFNDKKDDEQFMQCFLHDITRESDKLFELRMMFYEHYPEYAKEVYIDVKTMMNQFEGRTIRLISFWMKNKIKSQGRYVYRYEQEFLDSDNSFLVNNGEYILNELLQYIPKECSWKVKYSEWSEKFVYKRGLERACVELVKKATVALCCKSPERFWECYESYMGQGYYVFNEIILTGLAVLPPEYSNRIMRYLCSDMDKNIFDYTSGAENELELVKEVLKIHADSCDKKELLMVENAIFRYISPNASECYKRRIEHNERKEYSSVYWSFWGDLQYELLRYLPKERISSKAKELLRILDRRFNKIPSRYCNTSGHSGWIKSPVSDKNISKRQWLQIITNSKLKNRNQHRWLEVKGGFIESSYQTYAGDFRWAVEQHPQEMIELVLKNKERVLPAFVDSLFLGVELSEKLEEIDSEVIERLLVEFPCNMESHRAWYFCGIIQKISNVSWNSEVMEQLINIALKHCDPELDKPNVINSEDEENNSCHMLRSNALNCVRGSAARAIGHLLWEVKGTFVQFKDVIEGLTKDENPAVRFSSLYALWPSYNIDKEWAAEKILYLYESDIRMASFYNSKNMFFLLYPKYKERIIRIIEKCFESEDNELVEVGGYAVCEFYIQHNEFETIIMSAQTKSDEQIKAILDMAVIYLKINDYRNKAKDIILAYKNVDTNIQFPLAKMFYDKAVDAKRDKMFLHEFMKSKASRELVWAFTCYLEESTDFVVDYADIIIQLCENVLRMEAEDLSKQWGIVDEISKLIISLYDETVNSSKLADKQIADKCLNLWDIMFERQLGSVREISRQLMER